MRVLHVNYSDVAGGAARAAVRINQALNEVPGITSNMLVRTRSSDAGSIVEYSTQGSLVARVRRLLRESAEVRREQSWASFSSVHNPYLSRADIKTDLLKSVDLRDYDLVNLHWLGRGTLSVEEVGAIDCPVVWTMHDMWPFCGAEHYVPDLPEARFRVGYRADNRAEGESGPDMNSAVWKRKRAAWTRHFTAIGPSQWICRCARESILFHDQSVVHIPNPIDAGLWQPQQQAIARRVLGIPEDKKIVLFGAFGGEADPRKGADLMHSALHSLAGQSDDALHLVVFGQSEPDCTRPLPYPSTYLGQIDDDLSMVTVYNSADVMVVSSRQDNQPLTAVEAQACGVPVVAFGVGGLPEIVEHQVTGAIAKPFDCAELADCIAWVLADPARRSALGDAARSKVLNEFAEDVVARQYTRLYEQVLMNARP